MNISTLPTRLRPLTNQQIADLALVEDQARRRARAQGNYNLAMRHMIERDRLLDLIS